MQKDADAVLVLSRSISLLLSFPVLQNVIRQQHATTTLAVVALLKHSSSVTGCFLPHEIAQGGSHLCRSHIVNLLYNIIPSFFITSLSVSVFSNMKPAYQQEVSFFLSMKTKLNKRFNTFFQSVICWRPAPDIYQLPLLLRCLSVNN